MFAGLILAGGEGKRWGGPKAWAGLPDGRSFLEACTASLREAGAVRITATVPKDSQTVAIEGLDGQPLREDGLDMFASMLFGLNFLIQSEDWDRLVVWPVDHPLVLPESVERLVTTRHRTAILSYRGKHGHPICIDREIVASIVIGDLAGPTMREVLREVGAVSVEVDDPGVVANCNTPEALEAALITR